MLYILPMKQKMSDFQEKVLGLLSRRINDFYLAGGTALSLYYFHHRESQDLDFFTKKFNRVRIANIIKALSQKSKKEIELIAEQRAKDRIKIAVYIMRINKKESLKIDFVEDYVDIIKNPKLINGIYVLSLEDIYIRKILAISGTFQATDFIGRKIFQGGRKEAKDFYDLYCLSSIFMRLSDFSYKYASLITREALVRWFRTFSRFDIKTGILELKLKKQTDYQDMERHFRKEIDKILEKEVELI